MTLLFDGTDICISFFYQVFSPGNVCNDSFVALMVKKKEKNEMVKKKKNPPYIYVTELI